MQFEMNHKVGTDYSTVILQGHLSAKVLESLYAVFEKLGAICPNNNWDEWQFPAFITPQVLQEVIHNTCFVCGGLMKDSNAFKNQDIIEIPNSFSMTSHVYSNAGEARQIKVRKCSSCGHSHT